MSGATPPASGRNVSDPVTPALALVPGALILVVGVWMVLAEGPFPLAAACVAVGWTLVLVGGVAHGVGWGLQLRDREPG